MLPLTPWESLSLPAMHSVFLSHSSADKEVCRLLASALEQRGIRVWLDEKKLQAGDLLDNELDVAIRDSEYVCVVLSPSACNSTWVAKEIELTEKWEKQQGRVKLLPVLAADCNVPPAINGRVWVDLRNPSGFAESAFRLLTRIMKGKVFESLGAYGPWTSGDVALGVRWRVLSVMEGNIEFTTEFLDNLVAWSEKDGEKSERLSVPIAGAVLDTSPEAIFQDVLATFVSRANWHLVDRLLDIGLDEGLFELDEAGWTVSAPLKDILTEILLSDVDLQRLRKRRFFGESQRMQKKRRQILLAFEDAVTAQLSLRNSGHIHFANLLSRVTFILANGAGIVEKY